MTRLTANIHDDLCTFMTVLPWI